MQTPVCTHSSTTDMKLFRSKKKADVPAVPAESAAAAQEPLETASPAENEEPQETASPAESTAAAQEPLETASAGLQHAPRPRGSVG